MTKANKIAYLCERLGPYHFAQLNAASSRVDIYAIELLKKDLTYEWDLIEAPCLFQRTTLFSDTRVVKKPISVIIKKVYGVLSEIKPQVVAIPGWDQTIALIALWWCLDNDTPTIIMSDSNKHDDIRMWWKEFVKRKIVKLNSSGFVAGSSSMDYLKSLGMPETRILTGYDVVDNAFFSESSRECQQDSAAARKRLGLPEKYFLASNRFVPKKNLFFLLQVYAEYCKKAGGDPWKLVLLGDGPLRDQIFRLREELSLTDKVILPGFRQYGELPAYYGFAGAFIHASTSETWGLVVNEAMACGLPVIISSACGCASDLVRRGYNGFTFDPFDSDELSEHMVHVSSDKCNRVEMGQASRKIIDSWSLDTFTSNLIKAANAALEAPRPRFGNGNKALLWGLIHRRRSH